MVIGQGLPIAIADLHERADIESGRQKAERMVAGQAVYILEKDETATRITMKNSHR
jgi:hypothetical protein